MKIYIAGPMSGHPQLNYPAFHAAAATLRAHGHQVENPAENPEPPCGSWEAYMRMALTQLLRCDTVALLQDWETSRGATEEQRLAHLLKLRVVRIEALTSIYADPMIAPSGERAAA